jgi:lysophospholipase L1-like esterase
MSTTVIVIAVAVVVCLIAIIILVVSMHSTGTGTSLTTGPYTGAYTKPYTGAYPTWLDSSFLKSTLGGGIRPVEYKWNVAQIGANTAGPLDFIMYGDSITSFIHEDPKKQAAFTKYFPKGLPLGVGGNHVEQLAWRLAKGGEVPKYQPRTVCLLIGINNLNYVHNDPSVPLAWIISFLKSVMPSTKIVIMALLPTTSTPAAPLVKSTNAAYGALAARMGVTYAACGQSIDPKSKMLQDGLHPTPAGYDAIFTELKSKLG